MSDSDEPIVTPINNCSEYTSNNAHLNSNGIIPTSKSPVRRQLVNSGAHMRNLRLSIQPKGRTPKYLSQRKGSFLPIKPSNKNYTSQRLSCSQIQTPYNFSNLIETSKRKNTINGPVKGTLLKPRSNGMISTDENRAKNGEIELDDLHEDGCIRFDNLDELKEARDDEFEKLSYSNKRILKGSYSSGNLSDSSPSYKEISMQESNSTTGLRLKQGSPKKRFKRMRSMHGRSANFHTSWQ